jgi:7-cyano-7-deazaguanine synthase in queuosine biosynthesis
MNHKTCILSSGGMDSFLAWRLFAPKAQQVFIRLDQPYLAKETDAMWAINKMLSTKFEVLDAPSIGKQATPEGIILHRNAALILTAAMRYNRIMMGVLADEINSDKSVEFFSAMETVLNISHRAQYWNKGVGVEYKVWSPIRQFSKSELVALYLKKKFSREALLATVSCYSADYGHCGACPSCFKRWVALVNNRLDLAFKTSPLEWATEQGIIKKATDGTYAPKRANEILQAVKHQ